MLDPSLRLQQYRMAWPHWLSSGPDFFKEFKCCCLCGPAAGSCILSNIISVHGHGWQPFSFIPCMEKLHPSSCCHESSELQVLQNCRDHFCCLAVMSPRFHEAVQTCQWFSTLLGDKRLSIIGARWHGDRVGASSRLCRSCLIRQDIRS